MPKDRLVLKGFSPIKGDKARRAINSKTGEVISRREFVKRAERVAPKPPKPPKVKETRTQKRARWYANHINRQVWLDDGASEDYISFQQAMDSPEFQYFEHLIHSRYKEDREMGYEYFEELEDEFLTQDWGETP